MELKIDIAKGVLTVPEAAYFLNCSSQKIYSLIKLEKIEALSLVHYQNVRLFKQSQEALSDTQI